MSWVATPGAPRKPVGGRVFTVPPTSGLTKGEGTMRIWHDLWPELVVLLVLCAMAGGLALQVVLIR